MLHVVEARAELGHFALQHGDVAVPQLRGALEVAVPLGALGVELGDFEPLLAFLDRGDRVLLRLPVRDHPVALLLQRLQLGFERVEARLRGVVGLLLQRGPLDLELPDAAFDHVDLERHRIDLDAQPRRGLVDEVDRLVGQLARRDVTVGEHRGRDEGGVLDANAVMDLVALLQPAEDRDRVLDRRLTDVHLLEPPLERGVLLDVLAVLVECRRTDEPQLAARQHRLDHVAGVDRTFGAARADERVQLVDERDDLALGVGDLLEHRLEPLLELAAVLRAGDHRTDVERDDALVAQTLGDVAFDDAARQPFDDRGLADTGLADEHRVVLGAARQDLDDPPDLLVAADHRVDLALARRLGEVAAVLLERLVLLFGVVARHPVRAAHLTQRVERGVARDAGTAQEVTDASGHVGHREQDVLGREELVVELGAFLVGVLQDTERVGRELRVAHGRATDPRLATELVVDATSERDEVDADPFDHSGDDAFGLVEQRTQQVRGRHLGVPRLPGARLRRAERLLGLAGESVGIKRHVGSFGPSPGTSPSRFESHHGGRAQRYELTPVLPMNTFDARFDFLAHRVDARLELRDAFARGRQLVFEREHPLHADEADALVAQLLDPAEQLDVALRVPPAASARARRLDQTLALVDAQGLRMHPRQLGRDRDDVQGARVGVSGHGHSTVSFVITDRREQRRARDRGRTPRRARRPRPAAPRSVPPGPARRP